jgi:hypothetical protein
MVVSIFLAAVYAAHGRNVASETCSLRYDGYELWDIIASFQCSCDKYCTVLL